MKAVISVIGKDAVGILSKYSACCAQHNANVIDVTQSVMQDLFVMIMMVDIDDIHSDFTTFASEVKEVGKGMNLVTHVMHEDVFNT
ncbi:MAG: ACT domain-containing protein, partial [Clostridia bacterium]|nr:ACT domain-containing protein [Clostridia bacterium]